MNNAINGVSNLYFVEVGLCLMSVVHIKVKRICKYVNRISSILCFLYVMKVIALKLHFISISSHHISQPTTLFSPLMTFDFSGTLNGRKYACTQHFHNKLSLHYLAVAKQHVLMLTVAKQILTQEDIFVKILTLYVPIIVKILTLYVPIVVKILTPKIHMSERG